MTEGTRVRNARAFADVSVQGGVSPSSPGVRGPRTPPHQRKAQAARERRERAFDETIALGGFPLDSNPDYLVWFVRECVERGTVSALDWVCRVCRVCRQDEDAILDAWCRLAVEDGNLWAWREARAKLEGLLVRGEPVPQPLRHFVLAAAPAANRGRDREGSCAVMTHFMMRILEDEGFEPHEVNAQFGASFPSEGRQDPGTTLRKRRARGRGFVDPAFDGSAAGASPAPRALRPIALSYDWSAPGDSAVVMIDSDWPVFALAWELWPDDRAEHLALWSEGATSELWVWEELRALWDHAVYCGWDMPQELRDVVALPRPPKSRGRRPHRVALRFAAVETKLVQMVHSESAARILLVGAIERLRALHERADPPGPFARFGAELDDSALRRRYFSGRERLQAFIACTRG